MLIMRLFQLFQALPEHIPQFIQQELLAEQREVWESLLAL